MLGPGPHQIEKFDERVKWIIKHLARPIRESAVFWSD